MNFAMEKTKTSLKHEKMTLCTVIKVFVKYKLEFKILNGFIIKKNFNLSLFFFISL